MKKLLFALAFCPLLAQAQPAQPPKIECTDAAGLTTYLATLKVGGAFADKLARLAQNTQNLIDVHAKLIAVSEAKPGLAVCASPLVNAMVMDGGKVIYVFEGLVSRYGHEPAYLAAVLSHELGHVARKHFEYRKNARDYLVSQATNAAYGEYYRSGDVKKAKAAAAVAFAARASAFSREQEVDADGYGTVLLSKAGYPPQAMGDMMNRLMLDKEGKMETSWLDSHPGWAERLDRVEPRIYDEEAERLAQSLEAGGDTRALARQVNDWLRRMPESGNAWIHKAALLEKLRRPGSAEAYERALSAEHPALIRPDAELQELWLRLCVGLYKEGDKLESAECSRLLKTPELRARYRDETFGGLLFVHGPSRSATALVTARDSDGSRIITNVPDVLKARGLAPKSVVPWRPVRFGGGEAEAPLPVR